MDFGTVVHTDMTDGPFSVVLVCEHASNRIPKFLGDMGLSQDALRSHIAWDPGALSVAQGIAKRMSAPLVHGGVSRLVYDCNRPPESPGAMPERSEDYRIPANIGLSEQDRQHRVEGIYRPFTKALSDLIAENRGTLELMVTIHSFTPVYHGQKREVELGVLHGADDRFARVMMAAVPTDQPFVTRLNEPYSAADGVAHTLDAQAVSQGLPNVMIEIRNDLIQTPQQQEAMADYLVSWLQQSLVEFQKEGAA
ncbi:N-formylglutamate amidohydrolase [Ruegeria sp. R14_0]|uniref:N-formylglutamate amidohydrolase n=1 Tax=Ruegeria sp. R14_0 TaxID=2821100 RepID=UPI001FFE109B|nr:N-formylglutamate amidohydrolase [Ruegeria sp. R14_0]